MPRKQSPDTQIRELKRSLTVALRSKWAAESACRENDRLLKATRAELFEMSRERDFLREQIDRLTTAMSANGGPRKR